MARWPALVLCLALGGLTGGLVTTGALLGQSPTKTPVPKEMTSYRDVVKRVLPAVVSVEAVPKMTARAKQPQQRRRGQAVPGIPEEFRRFFPDLDDFDFETPDDVNPGHAFGSGFIVDPKGVILTNFHVVGGAERVKITLKDGREFSSKDIHGDRKNDLAIVRINAGGDLPYLELGDSDGMEIGDRVLAVGAPFGLAGSVTSGIVSATGRTGLNDQRTVYEDYLQTDAAINPGNSGGPLVNLAGQVIGINTAIKTRNGTFSGVGLAITSNVARDIMNQLVRYGTVHRGYLGVSVGPLDANVAQELGLTSKEGLVVSKVFPDTPAAKAGIKELDVITQVDGKPVKEARELQRIVAHLPLHKAVDVTVVHEGKTKQVPVTIEEQPDSYGTVLTGGRGPRNRPNSEAEEQRADKFGVELSDVTPELAKQYGYDENAKGAVVTRVDPGSPAADARLGRGVLIQRVGKKAVANAAEAREALEGVASGKAALLQVEYPPGLGGGAAYLSLRAPETSNKK